MALTEDFTDFFDTDDFAITATYNGSSVVGIFDEPFHGEDAIQDISPAFHCAAADVSGIAKGSTITINETDYEVIELQPDVTGDKLKLMLHEA